MTATRYVAFLRGINVGGHTVKMDALRRQFEGLGFTEASTFIASGNVLFTAEAADAEALERTIEQTLHQALGYAVATFLRTDAEVARIAAYAPFPDQEGREGDTAYITFLPTAPDAATRERVLALSNEHDVLALHEREMYWLRRGSLLDTSISTAAFARAFGGMPTTVRNANTLRRLAAKLSAA
jgi:uncharacterized protein (DUF1697 family)